jgi:hypothetical protein
MLAVVVALAAAVMALALAAAGSSGSRDDPAEATSSSEGAPDRGPDVRGAGPMSLGADDAPVVMVMYSRSSSARSAGSSRATPNPSWSNGS